MPTMTPRFDTHVRALRAAALEGKAHTDVALRAAVERRAASLGSGAEPPPDADIPAPLLGYVDTVVRNAWKVTDADTDALRKAGWSEDAIFEITVCAAIGAASGRLQRAYSAMNGGS